MQYEPAAFAGWIWNKTRALGSLGRAYNYPHQVSVYHSMYRILRENNLAYCSSSLHCGISSRLP